MLMRNKEAAINETKFECLCNAPRLAPEFEFTKSLISIGRKLIRLATKELKSINFIYLFVE